MSRPSMSCRHPLGKPLLKTSIHCAYSIIHWDAIPVFSIWETWRKCLNLLEFDVVTGNWGMKGNELPGQNWTLVLGSQSLNYTVYYWNLTIEGDTVLMAPEWPIYDPLI